MEEILRKELITVISNFVSKNEMEIIATHLTKIFYKYDITLKNTEIVPLDNYNERIVKNYIASLRLEGKSETTIKQYYDAIQFMLTDINKNINDITTNDIRFHLANYQSTHKVSNTTVDNKRRFLSAFFKWLTIEEIIVKNPMLRINKIKDKYTCKKAFSDEDVEKLRDYAQNIEDRALIEFLLSTGCRVSEVVNTNLNNIDFDKGECTVIGKGNKERVVYINNKAMYYLKQYLNDRKSNSSSLFINSRGNRMSKETVRTRLNIIGKNANVNNVHPHRFRRTMASNLCKHGMPIQYTQKILGHAKIDTTMIYCMINDNSVKTKYYEIS